jgi:hypothetical protein
LEGLRYFVRTIWQSIMASDRHKLNTLMCSRHIEALSLYLRWKRIFVFLDEWFSYATIFYLFHCASGLLCTTGILVALCYNVYFYLELWKIRESCNIYAWLFDRETRVTTQH